MNLPTYICEFRTQLESQCVTETAKTVTVLTADIACVIAETSLNRITKKVASHRWAPLHKKEEQNFGTPNWTRDSQ